jgi:hypothetical protein
MMYSRMGGIEVSDTDAVTACRKFPNEWTLEPWTRPDGRPDVLIPTNWGQIGISGIIDLARSTVIDRRTKIETVEQAVEAISSYLAGSTPPEKVAQ